MNEEFLLIVESLEKYKDLLESKNDEICDGMTESEKRAYQLGITNLCTGRLFYAFRGESLDLCF